MQPYCHAVQCFGNVAEYSVYLTRTGFPTYGHLAGDRVLKEVGILLKRQLRASDILGRIGGEEFAVTMISCEPRKAYSVVDRLRHILAKYPVPYDNHEISFTVSCGVAGFNSGEQDLTALLRLADQALYNAKRSGRNCVKMAEPGLQEDAPGSDTV